MSMLPKDTLARRESTKKQMQTRLDAHLTERPQKEHVVVVPYSDDLFNSAAQEWLITTEQVRYHIDPVPCHFLRKF